MALAPMIIARIAICEGLRRDARLASLILFVRLFYGVQRTYLYDDADGGGPHSRAGGRRRANRLMPGLYARRGWSSVGERRFCPRRGALCPVAPNRALKVRGTKKASSSTRKVSQIKPSGFGARSADEFHNAHCRDARVDGRNPVLHSELVLLSEPIIQPNCCFSATIQMMWNARLPMANKCAPVTRRCSVPCR